MPSFCTYFISDLHLQPDRPDITKHFREFMQTRARFTDALYILGDLFEYWIGDQDDNGFNQSIYNELNYIIQQGIPIYFMRGNRDYLIDEKFAQKTGVTLLHDPTVITLYGKQYLLSHGDCLCTTDKTYQRFRRIMQSRLMKKAALATPHWLRKRITKKIRQKSNKHNQKASSIMMDVHQPAVEAILKKHHVHHLIHGHTHQPHTHHFQIDGEACTRTVLGCWEQKIDYLKIEP
jgi:UDP-2,3-diacylglucosamine hydrolase